jgi:CubicO group peptidase (beta-lactamase class C family)
MNMQKPLFAFLFTCVVGLTLAQTPRHYTLQEAGPEAAGFSAERLGRMDRVIQEYVDQKRIPGAVALVARHGKIIYYKGFGQDDVDAKTPLKRDAIFRVASQTKAVTSVAAMMLFEEGKFLLDEPVSKYLPAFKNPKVLSTFNEKDSSYTTVPAKSEITIRQLLSHTSGISYAGIGTKEANAIYAKAKVPSGIGTPNDKLADAMNKLGGLPLIHQPGEKWSYGLNTDVLGYLVEVLSGTTLDAFFRTRIFEPLGMKDTYFYLPKDRHNRLATLYMEDQNKAYRKRPAQGNQTPDYPKQAGTYYSGGAGLSSTAYDYAVFLQMLLNGGEYNGKRLLSPATVRMMTSNQIGELSLGLKKFGLGFGLITEREAARMPVSAGSFEWGGIFGTTYWADPQEGVVALLYTQKFPNSYGDLADKFRVLVYQALTGTPAVAP